MSKICCQIAVKARNVSNTNRLKQLVEMLEQSRGSSKLFGVPKGGHGPFRPLPSTNVLPAAFHRYCRPPTSAIIRCYLPVTVSERVSAGSIAPSLQGVGNALEGRFRPLR